MAEIIHTDICVIGGGSGGLSVVSKAVQIRAETLLIERGKMGGDCLNTGCVPSKALLAASKAAMGIHPPAEPEIDFATVKTHVADLIAGIAPYDSVKRFTALGVRVIQLVAEAQTDAQLD